MGWWQKKGEQVWGKFEGTWQLNIFDISNCWVSWWLVSLVFSNSIKELKLLLYINHNLIFFTTEINRSYNLPYYHSSPCQSSPNLIYPTAIVKLYSWTVNRINFNWNPYGKLNSDLSLQICRIYFCPIT